MPSKSPRVAVRAIIVHDGHLLLVNAWADGRHGLMCAPGGGAEPGVSLPEQRYRSDTARRRIISKLTTTPGTFCYSGPVALDRASPPTRLNEALEQAELEEQRTS